MITAVAAMAAATAVVDGNAAEMKRLLTWGAYRPTEQLRRHKKAGGRTFARQRRGTAGRL